MTEQTEADRLASMAGRELQAAYVHLVAASAFSLIEKDCEGHDAYADLADGVEALIGSVL